MSYRVKWAKAAEDELANVWLQSADRQAVTAAANAIDRSLERDPENQGESRPKGRRIAFFMPLAVFYRIVPGKRLVKVLRI